MNVLQYYYEFKANRIALRIKASVMSLVADKMVKFHTHSSSMHTPGKISNYIAVDSMKMEYSMHYIKLTFVTFNSIIVGLVAVFLITGLDFIWVVLICFGFFLINFLFFWIKGLLTGRILKRKDKRIGFFSNVLKNLEYVKVHALENYYALEIYKKREKEISMLYYFAFLYSVSYFVDWGNMFFSTIAVILLFSFKYQKGFTFAKFSGFSSLFNSFNRSMVVINLVIVLLADIMVSGWRVTRFILEEENIHDNKLFSSLSMEEGIVLDVNCSSFVWPLSNKTETSESKKEMKVIGVNNRF